MGDVYHGGFCKDEAPVPTKEKIGALLPVPNVKGG